MDILTWDVFDICISNIIRDISTEKLKKKKKEHIFKICCMETFPSCGVNFCPLLCHFCGDIKRTKQYADSGWRKEASEIKIKAWKTETSFMGVLWGQNNLLVILRTAKNLLKSDQCISALKRTGCHWAAWWHHSLLPPPPHNDPRYPNPPLYCMFPNKT